MGLKPNLKGPYWRQKRRKERQKAVRRQRQKLEQEGLKPGRGRGEDGFSPGAFHGPLTALPTAWCWTSGSRSWWRDLTKSGPLEQGMANHFSILALRTPWTV